MTEDSQPESRSPQKPTARPKRRFEMWLGIARITLREPIKRIAGHVIILVIIAAGIWAARMGFGTLSVAAEQASEQVEAQPTQGVSMPEVVELPLFAAGGPLLEHEITRTADIHTVLRDRPRMDIVKYVVQSGDTLFGIAEKFALKPESVLWANFDVLKDDPHRLQPG
ncbi:MAG: LysM domain-containing protein, partial [Anaerolineales bacterium]